ncbi:MAG: N-acetylmuramoyl-L-alanine amidase family protein [Oscillospiraceae bacterium]|nr:N-acetylmuramoyl-L-alanine amidase family protein [Oscillospiraceae bacterium]
MRKKLLSMLTCLMVLLTIISPAAFADTGTPLTVTADQETVEMGDIVTFTVTMGAIENLTAADIYMEIPEGLEYVDGSGAATEGLDDLMGMQGADCDWNAGMLQFGCYGNTDGFTSAEEIDLFSFQCEVITDAVGDITVAAEDYEFYTPDFDLIEVSSFPAVITVTHDCVYDQQVVKDEYIASEADCENPASYHVTCVCGAFEEDGETFTDGEKLGHDFTRESGVLADEAENCSEHDTYWYGCTRCDALSETDTYEGDAGDHDFTRQAAEPAFMVPGTGLNCKDPFEYYYACQFCDDNSSEIWVSSDFGDCEAGEWQSDGYSHWKNCIHCSYNLVPPEPCSGGTATCTEKAECEVCGNFYGITEPHDFVEKIADEAHYVAGTGVDCQHAKEYYFDCTGCDEIGTATWVSEEVGPHSMSTEWTTENGKHFHECTVAGCGHVEDEADCSGGAATCTEKAECEVCGKPYGTTDPHNFAEMIEDEAHYVAGTGADCQHAKEYYFDCTGCDEIGTETWKGAEVGPHSMSTEWTTKDGKHFHKCTVEDCDYIEDEADCSGGAATCTEQAECEVCGEPYGEPLYHDFTVKDNASLKDAAADCQHFDTYWYGCSRCDAHSTEDWYESEDAGEHAFTAEIAEEKYLVDGTGLNCQEYKQYYKACAVCGEKGTETWVSTEAGPHSFTKKVADAAHLVAGTGADCQHVKEYYYACANDGCAEIGTEAWASEEVGAHVMSENWTTENEKHFHKCTVSGCEHIEDEADCFGGEASCTEKAVCETCNTPYGEVLPHDFDLTVWNKGDASGHWHDCKDCSAHDEPVAHTPNGEPTEYDDSVCTECGYVIAPALGHDHLGVLVEGYAPKCTETGMKDAYLCRCGIVFWDEACTEAVASEEELVIPELGHDWAEATCQAPKTCQRTDCGLTEGDVADHDFAPATCEDPEICRFGCGTTRGEPAGHEYVGSWKYDEEKHWKECDCGDEGRDGKHKDKDADGACDTCGYVMDGGSADVGGGSSGGSSDGSSAGGSDDVQLPDVSEDGWKQTETGDWYYVSEGELAEGWKFIGGYWFFFSEEKDMQTGWLDNNGYRYYLNDQGAMHTGWLLEDDSWYYFPASGAMKTGWFFIDGDWYYFNADGVMQTGWENIGGKWYYFDASGAMYTNWLFDAIYNAWYYLHNTNGHMLTDTVTPDGYRVDASGKWVF